MAKNTNSTHEHIECSFVYPTYIPSSVVVKYSLVDLRRDVSPPHHQSTYSAGADIRSAENVIINPNETKVIRTNLKVEIPKGYFLEVRSRSGLAANYSVFVLNSPGTIDEDYKDEIMIILHNSGIEPFEVEINDRIAQVLLRNYTQIKFVNSDIDVSDKNRGGGFGSTGIK